MGVGVRELEDVELGPQMVVGSYSPRGEVVAAQSVTYSSIAELQ